MLSLAENLITGKIHQLFYQAISIWHKNTSRTANSKQLKNIFFLKKTFASCWVSFTCHKCRLSLLFSFFFSYGGDHDQARYVKWIQIWDLWSFASSHFVEIVSEGAFCMYTCVFTKDHDFSERISSRDVLTRLATL